ncbi:MAG: hypothetical protein R2875_04845 [Desulfobacterales bacterium]
MPNVRQVASRNCGNASGNSASRLSPDASRFQLAGLTGKGLIA